VIAMQDSVTDAAGGVLAREFYRSLAKNLPIDECVARARRMVIAEGINNLDWGLATLYMRAPDGILFSGLGDTASSQSQPVQQPTQQASQPQGGNTINNMFGSGNTFSGSNISIGNVTAGNVNQSVNKTPESQNADPIRVDVATESEVIEGQEFEFAVSIRQPLSNAMTIDGLNNIASGDGTVFRKNNEPVSYIVRVNAPNCDVKPDKYQFRLLPNKDSAVQSFFITPKKVGTLAIIANAYQDDGEHVGSTRVRIKVNVESKPKTTLVSTPLNSNHSEDERQQDLQRLRDKRKQLKDSLHVLEMQEARFGINVPVHIALEIQDTKKKIADLEKQIKELGG
ncbi:MAG: hypothetical protein KAX40_07915, partial [Herpetosiphon sp.]|nr:hypothetical protein [Herpetosiphon sp.]